MMIHQTHFENDLPPPYPRFEILPCTIKHITDLPQADQDRLNNYKNHPDPRYRSKFKKREWKK